MRGPVSCGVRQETIGVSRGETIGLDLGDRYGDVCILDETGTEVRRERIATTQRGLKGWSGVRVVMEVGTHSPWISRLFQSLGHEVIVASPACVRRIAGKGDKTDQGDVELLAQPGRVGPKVLESIEHRGEAVQSTLRENVARTASCVSTRSLACR